MTRSAGQPRSSKPAAAPPPAAARSAAAEPADAEPGRARSRVTGWPIAATLAVVAIAVYAIRYALIPFVLAIAIAFVLEPLVVRAQPWTGRRRWVAAAALAAVAVLLIAGAAYWVGTAAVADLAHFARRAPAIASGLVGELAGPQITVLGQTYTPDQLVHELGGLIAAALGGSAAIKAAGIGIGTLFGGFLTLALIPYMMISGPRLAAGALWLVPPERRRSVEQLLSRIIPALRRYLVGVVVIISYTAVIAYIGFGLVFAIPHAPLLAVTVGLLEMIPLAGPFTSGMLVALTAFQQPNLTALALLIAFAVALRLSIDNLVGPLVLGQAGRIHPVVVIFSFVCGAMLFGVIGLLLAVPTAVCLRIVLQRYYAEPIRTGDDG